MDTRCHSTIQGPGLGALVSQGFTLYPTLLKSRPNIQKARSTAARVSWGRSIQRVLDQVGSNKAVASEKLAVRTLKGVVQDLHQEVWEFYSSMGRFVHHRKP